jgi:ADP-ribose pyrophosphatase YjhB (NUDIX family)
LLFKKENNDFKFLLRYQPLPELSIKNSNWRKLYPCCVTGSLEEKETPLQNTIKEIYEETNCVVTKKNFICHGQNVSSTQMNETVYIFVVDVTNCKFVSKKSGDGSIFENISKNKWVTHKQIKDILNSNQHIYLSSLASAYLLFHNKILKLNAPLKKHNKSRILK